jgi:hypothetical protein
MKVYARISESNEILELVSPDWRDSSGNQITDDQIFMAERIVPVDYESRKPEVDPFYQEALPKPMLEWTLVTGEAVVKVWNEVEKQFVEAPRSNWPIRVEVEYDVVTKTLDEKKQELRSQLKFMTDQEVADGFLYRPLNIKLDADTPSIVNLMLLREWAQANSIPNITIRTYDNTFVEVRTSDLDSIIKAIASWKMDLYQNKWETENQLMSASDMNSLKLASANLVNVPSISIPIENRRL